MTILWPSTTSPALAGWPPPACPTVLMLSKISVCRVISPLKLWSGVLPASSRSGWLQPARLKGAVLQSALGAPQLGCQKPQKQTRGGEGHTPPPPGHQGPGRAVLWPQRHLHSVPARGRSSQALPSVSLASLPSLSGPTSSSPSEFPPSWPLPPSLFLFSMPFQV